MHTGESLPSVSEAATVSEALLEMTAKRLGFTTVLGDDGHLIEHSQTVTCAGPLRQDMTRDRQRTP